MGTREINFHALLKDELVYEVSIRSETPGATVSVLRKQMRTLLGECPSEGIRDTDLDPSEEIKVVGVKLEDLKGLLDKYNQSPEPYTLVRLKALSYHLYHRLARIQPEETQMKLKLTEFTSLMNKLLAKVEQLGSQRLQAQTVPDTMESSSPSADILGDKCVAKWNIKFNGVTDPRSFLERVEDLQRADGVSDAKLLNSASRLFTDQALIWFRAVRERVSTWKELTTLFLKDFDQVDYDYKLLGEIRLRTQGVDEPLHIYFSIMSCMFDRLSKPLPETEKLEILRRNIRPFYSQPLALVEISSINNLQEKCKIIEVTRQRCLSFAEPNKQNYSVLTSEFQYKPKSKQALASVSVKSNISQPNISQPKNNKNKSGFVASCQTNSHGGSVANSKKLCFKCGKSNHNFGKCTNYVNKNCYCCGKAGHFSTNCPDKTKTFNRTTGSKNL